MTVVFVVILQDAVRKIPVQYAKKMQGRKMVGGQTSNIPLKVNTSGVIPIIFAQSIMQFPIIICAFIGYNGTGVWAEILKGLNSGYWCKPSQPIYSLGLLLYIELIVFFAYFYTSITFNPVEVSERLKERGSFIPGHRPGKQTAEYLQSVSNSTIVIGAVGLLIVALVPIVFSGLFGADVSFGGTSLIIIVGVIIETIRQIDSKVEQRHLTGIFSK